MNSLHKTIFEISLKEFFLKKSFHFFIFPYFSNKFENGFLPYQVSIPVDSPTLQSTTNEGVIAAEPPPIFMVAGLTGVWDVEYKEKNKNPMSMVFRM